MPHFQLPTSLATVTSTSSLPPSSLSYRLGYNLLSYRLGYNLPYISTSSFWSRSPTCLTEPRPSSLLDGRLARKDYLQISAFLDLVVVEREGVPHALQDGWLDAARPDSRDVNISFYRLPCVVEARLPCVVETAESRRSRRNSR